MERAFSKAWCSSAAEMRRSCSSNCGVCWPSPQMIRKMILERYQFITDRFCSKILEFDAAEDGGAVDDQDLFGIGDGGLLPFVFESGEQGGDFGADFPVCG